MPAASEFRHETSLPVFISHQLTSPESYYAPPVISESDLIAFTFESLQKIRTANKICQAVRIRIGLPGNAGKIQENRSGFLGRFKGSGGNRNPPGSFFLLPAFSFWRSKKENAEKHRSYKSKVPFPSSPLDGNYKGVKFNLAALYSQHNVKSTGPKPCAFLVYYTPIFARRIISVSSGVVVEV